VIVVDTSVWIGHFRNEQSTAVAKLRAIPNPNDIIVGDLILLECLQGARDDAHAARMEAALRTFQIESMLGDQPAVEAARMYRALRALGQTPRKTVDVIIGAFCIRRGYQLLHQDRDFDAMSAYLGLETLKGVTSCPVSEGSRSYPNRYPAAGINVITRRRVTAYPTKVACVG